MTCPKCSHLENELLQKNSQITHYESKIRGNYFFRISLNLIRHG